MRLGRTVTGDGRGLGHVRLNSRGRRRVGTCLTAWGRNDAVTVGVGGLQVGFDGRRVDVHLKQHAEHPVFALDFLQIRPDLSWGVSNGDSKLLCSGTSVGVTRSSLQSEEKVRWPTALTACSEMRDEGMTLGRRAEDMFETRMTGNQGLGQVCDVPQAGTCAMRV